MKRYLNDSVVFFGIAILVGGLTFGLLDQSVFGATWFKTCVNIGPCPGPPGSNCPAGALPNQSCEMCQFSVPRGECQWILQNVQCTELPGAGVCGIRTLGLCQGPLLPCVPTGPAGTCDAPSCASGPIIP